MEKKNVINEQEQEQELELILWNRLASYVKLNGEVENEEEIIQQVLAWGKERTLQKLEDLQNENKVLCIKTQKTFESLNKKIIFEKEKIRKERIFEEAEKDSLIDKLHEGKVALFAQLLKIIALPLIFILGAKSYFLWEFCDISRGVAFMDVCLNTLLVIFFSYLYYVCTSKIMVKSIEQKKKLIDERIAEDEAKLQSMEQRAFNMAKELEVIEDLLQKLDFYFFEEVDADEEVKNAEEEKKSEEDKDSEEENTSL